MPYYSMILLQAASHDAVVDAVRSSYLAAGAVEGGDHHVHVGEPRRGWSAITDDTLHTVHTGVAEDLASRLRTRTLVAGFRGWSDGRAAARTYGPWKTKIPTSSTCRALYGAIDKLGHDLILESREVVTRPGTTLAFRLPHGAEAARGPFKSNSAAELREQRRALGEDIVHHMMNDLGNKQHDAVHSAIAALVALDEESAWKYAYNELVNSISCSPHELNPFAAGVLRQVFEHAGHPVRGHGQIVELAAAAVVNDSAWCKQAVARVPASKRGGVGKKLWTDFGDELAEFVTPATHALVTKSFPDPERREIASATPAPVSSSGRHPGLRTFGARPKLRERQLVGNADCDLELADSIAYVGRDLLIGLMERLCRYRDGKLAGSCEVGDGGIFHIAAASETTALTHDGRKVVEVTLPAMKIVPLWNVPGETLGGLAVAPGGRIAIAGADFSMSGRIYSPGETKTRLGFGGYHSFAWLDDNRLAGVAYNNDKTAVYVTTLDGTETCYGSIRGSSTIVCVDGAVYLATSKSICRVDLSTPRAENKPAVVFPVWTGPAAEIAVDDGILYAATPRGVLAIDAAGTVVVLSERPAIHVAAAGGRVAFVQSIVDDEGVTRASVFELVP